MCMLKFVMFMTFAPAVASAVAVVEQIVLIVLDVSRMKIVLVLCLPFLNMLIQFNRRLNQWCIHMHLRFTRMKWHCAIRSY